LTILEFSTLVWAISCLAGFIGALTGLGGGVLIVPLLTSLFAVDIHYAMGASLVSVIATSCGAAATYIRQGYTNLRLGMFLEVATTLGALVGASLATAMASQILSLILAIVLIYSAFVTQQDKPDRLMVETSDPLAQFLQLKNSFPNVQGQIIPYGITQILPGFSVMALAGVLSGLLGIGSGAFKVLAMDQVMKLPFKVSTATSSFTIGVTAATSAGVYLSRGYVDPGLSFAVMLGILPGAFLGAKLLGQVNTHSLRLIFSLVLVATAFKIVYSIFTV
jgi:uncharacterized protein